MELVFMIWGESAGVAASRALQKTCPVQDIEMEQYLARLKEAGQKLSWHSGQ